MNEMREEIIQLLKETTDGDDIRTQALKTTLGFKSAWILLAEKLREIEESGGYKQWEYKKFNEYCQQELMLNRTMVKKLLEGLNWIEQEAPQFKPLPQNRSQKTNLPMPLPDIETIAALNHGMRESEEKRIPYEKYIEVRDAALAGEATLSQIRKEFREAVPQEIRDAAVDPVKHVKRALTEIEKALNRLSEISPSDEKTKKISQLRDGLHELVSEFSNEDAPAPSTTPAPAVETPGGAITESPIGSRQPEIVAAEMNAPGAEPSAKVEAQVEITPGEEEVTTEESTSYDGMRGLDERFPVDDPYPVEEAFPVDEPYERYDEYGSYNEYEE